MKRIKFVSNGTSNQLTINPAAFNLRKYYQLFGKFNDAVTWLDIDFFSFKSVQDQASAILDDAPDLVGLSVYVWNFKKQFQLAELLKKENPEVVIVLGGPQLTAHKDFLFFKKYPYVDFAVYGDGEQAFTEIIDGLFDNSLPTVNTVSLENGEYYLSPFSRTTAPEYLSATILESQRDFVSDQIEKTRRCIKDAELSYTDNLKIGIEFARGCMYNCSFCDWSQNLSKKVTRKKFDWRAEVLFAQHLDLELRETDANFGQWPEDLEIYEFALSLYDPSKSFRFAPWNTPKLKKEISYYILEKNANVLGKFPKISLNDINESVLKNINRPEIPWTEHKKYIIELAKKVEAPIRVEIILGLPGQTFDTLLDTFQELNNLGIKDIQLYNWEFLANSPAAELSYRKRFNLSVIPGRVLDTREGQGRRRTFTTADIISFLEDENTAEFAGLRFDDSLFLVNLAAIPIIDLVATRIARNMLSIYGRGCSIRHLTDKQMMIIKQISLKKAQAPAALIDYTIRKFNTIVYAEWFTAGRVYDGLINPVAPRLG